MKLRNQHLVSWGWLSLLIFTLSSFFGLIQAQERKIQAPTLEELQASEPPRPRKKVTIAVIQDGPSPVLDRLVKKVETELKHLTKDEFEISILKKGYNAQWNESALAGLFRKAFNNSQVDMVFAAGILATQQAASPNLPLTKPVVAGLIQRTEVLTLPISSEGRSGKNNFVFAVINLSIQKDLQTFHEMIGFKKVKVLVDQKIIKNLKGAQQTVRKLEGELGFKIELVPVSDSVPDILSKITGDTEAIMYTALPSLRTENYQDLINRVNRKKIPTYSIMGHTDVHKGVLAGLTPETVERTSRRVALNLQQIMIGFLPEDLSVLMPIQIRLLINAKTARQIGYYPDFFTLRTATFINLELLRSGEALDLNKAINFAAQRNVDNKISQAETKVARQDSLSNRSFLLPQGEGRIDYIQIDRDRAVNSLGTTAQRETRAGLNFSQVIFDDALLARFRSSEHFYRSTRYQQEATKLDTMLSGGRSYLDLLTALALLKIETENLNLTEDHLAIARLKFEVGMSGLDEVYRWEAEEAQQKGAVYERVSQAQQALVALNQVMDFPSEKEWVPQDINFDQVTKIYFKGKFSELIRNGKIFEVLEDYLVEEAVKNSPEVKSFGEQITADLITLKQKKRRFYTPSLGVEFDYSRRVHSDNPGAVTNFTRDPDDWVLAGQVRLPIFQGGLRVHEMNRAKANFVRTNELKTRLLQLLERQVRSAVFALSSSGPNIYFTHLAADRAKLNLGLVQEKYTEGTVGIIDLLDAQREYITRERSAAIAIYTYISDNLDLQRSIAWFQAEKTPEEINHWVQNFERYLVMDEKIKQEFKANTGFIQKQVVP